jgi:general secretion pathway protein G
MALKRPHAMAGGLAQAGYSLLELLVVLAILALVIAIAAPRVIGYLSTSKVKVAEIQIQNIVTALDMYRMDNAAYPSEQQGLKALVERPEGAQAWNGPYLTRADGLVDPWGRPYLYRTPGLHGEVDVSSLGADGKDGGEGEDRDVGSW